MLGPQKKQATTKTNGVSVIRHLEKREKDETAMPFKNAGLNLESQCERQPCERQKAYGSGYIVRKRSHKRRVGFFMVPQP